MNFLTEKGHQDQHVGSGAGVGMSYLWLEVAGQLLAVAFSISHITPCGGSPEASKRMKELADVKRGSPAVLIFTWTGCMLIWPLRKVVQLFASKITFRGKKSDKQWSCHKRSRRSAWTTGWGRWGPVGSSKLLDELQGVMKLHASRPRLKSLFEQFIISVTQVLLWTWNKRRELHLNTSLKTVMRNKVSINSLDPLLL